MVSMYLSRDLDEASEMHYDVLADHQQPRSAAPPVRPASDLAFECRLRRIRDDIALPPQFTVLIERDKKVPNGRYYFQIEAERIDTFTGKLGTGRGGKAYLSEEATDSELVQTVFGLYDAYCHHEVRETFLWRGRRVFGPHVNIEAHWEVAERYDARPRTP